MALSGGEDGEGTGQCPLVHVSIFTQTGLSGSAARFLLKCESRFFSKRIEMKDSLTILHRVCCQ